MEQFLQEIINLQNDCGISNRLGIFLWVFLLVIVWSSVWKGLALWHAARRAEKVWFVVLLVVNTVGILEIIYLCAVAKVLPRRQEK